LINPDVVEIFLRRREQSTAVGCSNEKKMLQASYGVTAASDCDDRFGASIDETAD
jgi:hypothetical protein